MFQKALSEDGLFEEDTENVHVKKDRRQTIAPEISGAEYWSVVIDEEDSDVSLHFDSDYELMDSQKVFMHPLMGNVLYLSDVGQPTVVIGKKTSYLIEKKNPEEEDTANAVKNAAVITRNDQNFVVSHPKMGKWITFGGELLHG